MPAFLPLAVVWMGIRSRLHLIIDIHWLYVCFESPIRVLSRVYRLGEKSRVAEGHQRYPGACPPEICLNEYALRCNLVHFATHFEKCYSGILFYLLVVIMFLVI